VEIAQLSLQVSDVSDELNILKKKYDNDIRDVTKERDTARDRFVWMKNEYKRFTEKMQEEMNEMVLCHEKKVEDIEHDHRLVLGHFDEQISGLETENDLLKSRYEIASGKVVDLGDTKQALLVEKQLSTRLQSELRLSRQMAQVLLRNGLELRSKLNFLREVLVPNIPEGEDMFGADSGHRLGVAGALLPAPLDSEALELAGSPDINLLLPGSEGDFGGALASLELDGKGGEGVVGENEVVSESDMMGNDDNDNDNDHDDDDEKNNDIDNGVDEDNDADRNDDDNETDKIDGNEVDNDDETCAYADVFDTVTTDEDEV
jgi:hypothetical protein